MEAPMSYLARTAEYSTQIAISSELYIQQLNMGKRSIVQQSRLFIAIITLIMDYASNVWKYIYTKSVIIIFNQAQKVKI